MAANGADAVEERDQKLPDAPSEMASEVAEAPPPNETSVDEDGTATTYMYIDPKTNTPIQVTQFCYSLKIAKILITHVLLCTRSSISDPRLTSRPLSTFPPMPNSRQLQIRLARGNTTTNRRRPEEEP